MKRTCTWLMALAAATAIGCSTIDVAVFPTAEFRQQVKKIAVMPFNFKGQDIGQDFAGAIRTYLMQEAPGRFIIVEREEFDRIVDEQKMGATGLFDEGQAAKLGKMIGADIMIVGRGDVLELTGPGTYPGKHIHTCEIKVVSVEKGSLLVSLIKTPGIAWDMGYRAKWCFSPFGAGIWKDADLVAQSSLYSNLARQCVKRILGAIERVEKRPLGY